MMTRKQCEQIARDWFATRATEEYNRRSRDIRKPTHFFQLQEAMGVKIPPRTPERQAELTAMVTEAFMAGLYDPPMPTIPGFFERLFLSRWTPPEPTAEQWPMNTSRLDRP